MGKKRIRIKMDEEDYRKLQTIAEEKGIGVEEVIVQAIRDELKRIGLLNDREVE